MKDSMVYFSLIVIVGCVTFRDVDGWLSCVGIALLALYVIAIKEETNNGKQ